MWYVITILGFSFLLLGGYCWKKFRDIQGHQDDFEELMIEIDKVDKDAIKMNIARVEEIETLRNETPTYEINEEKEAILKTREGEEFLNYQLKSKTLK